MLDRPRLKPINPKRRKFPDWLKWTLILLAPFLVAFFPYSWIETKLYPVVSEIRILSAEEVAEGVVVTFEFDKYRSARPLGMDWYKEVRGRMEAITYKPYGSNKGMRNRPSGTQKSGPWLLKDVTLHEFECHMTAVAKHEGPLWWDSISELY